MALGTLGGYYAFSGQTADGGTVDASLLAILAGVEAAVKKLCRPFLFEAATLTDVILDAPWASNELLLPAVPVRSVTSVYYNPIARGVVASFTSDHLLTVGTDYQLPIDDPVNAWSRSGRLRRLNRACWGVSQVRPYGRLGFGPVPEPGSVKVTFAAGCTTVPAEVAEAVYLATSLVYLRRKGPPVTSSSWNGYSESVAAPFTTTAAVTSPDVLQLLAPYLDQIRVGGS